jgi:hypothetical protein
VRKNLMKIYKCDFCDKQTTCTAIKMDCKSYDICETCRTKMNKQLDGKGEFVWCPYYVPYYYTYVPSYPYIWWNATPLNIQGIPCSGATSGVVTTTGNLSQFQNTLNM